MKNTTPTTAELIQKWGTSVSIALLDPACKIFTIPTIEGIIGYREGFSSAVVLGDPVCSPQDLPALVKSFTKFCEDKKLCIVYTAASENFKRWAVKNTCKATLQVGEELIINPQINLVESSQGRKLRNKQNQAMRAGVTVHEYLPHDPNLEEAMRQVGVKWLKSRKGPQIYLANIHLFENPIGKRWFYAKQGEKIIGVLLLNRIEARQGWLFNLLLTIPDAPNGTTELLAEQTLAVLRQEGCPFVTIGVVTGNEPGEITGFGKISSLLARKGFLMAKWFFGVDSSKAYWSKFHPQCEGSYLLFSKGRITPLVAWDILRALNMSL